MSYSVSVSKAILVVISISDKIRQRMYEFLSAQMISKLLNIPKPTLVKILRNLTHARIIETKEGPRISNLLLMGYGGYAWRLFASGFYVKPWAGIGNTSTVSGKTEVGGERYDVLPVIGIATLHLGYMF